MENNTSIPGATQTGISMNTRKYGVEERCLPSIDLNNTIFSRIRIERILNVALADNA